MASISVFTSLCVLLLLTSSTSGAFRYGGSTTTTSKPPDTTDNPCAAALCLVGTKCVPRKVKVKCMGLGCPPTVDCVPITPKDSCPTTPCPPGTKCRFIPCLVPPCPPSRCVPSPPTPTNPCAAALCPVGTKCVPRKVKGKCTGLGCPPTVDCVPIPPKEGPSPGQDVCKLPVAQGPCRAHFPRYYYDGSTRQCRHFIYGGCLGNANRFTSVSECLKACRGNVKSVCKLPSETGPCRGHFPRYYYDGSTRQCRRFIYGGCLGNGNRFTSVAKCEKTCGGRYRPEPSRKSFY